MSAFKGTPGPWEVNNGIKVFSALGADSGDGVHAHSTGGWQIADCSESFAFVDGGGAELGHGIKRANAKLIAMSPQLLLALEDAVTIFRGLVDVVPSLRQRVEAYDNLIAKATE